MSRAKKVDSVSCEFNEAAGRGCTIASGLVQELALGTNPAALEDGEINTRYEVTVTVRELGDWDKT